MFQLSKKQAQEIVDKMMQDIPYNINIMNEQGVIVGSGRKERVGTVHSGAVKALETGRMIEVWEDSRFEKRAPTSRSSLTSSVSVSSGFRAIRTRGVLFVI